MRHVAIFPKDYIVRILNREKTIESRFSKVKCSPYGQVNAGDIIFLKEQSGPIVGQVKVIQVIFFSGLTPEKVLAIKRQYNDRLRADDDFWKTKMDANYATLMFLGDIQALSPYAFKKKDRRGWVVLDHPQLSFYR